MRDVAIANLRRWKADAVAFVREVFHEEPDAWQAEVLTAPEPRLAMQACQGPGKSHVLGWKTHQFLLTREDANIAALSITRDNLKSGLWKELALLYGKAPLLQKAFSFTDSAIASRERPHTWWCQARSFPQDADAERLKSTLSGLHSKHVMIALDEAGDMPVGLLLAAEGIFTTEGVEALLWMAGNPTSVDGSLYEAAVKRAHRYRVVEITGDPDDPKRSPRVSIEEARQRMKDFPNSPYVMVTVLGKFPPVAYNKLIGPEEVKAAQQRNIRPEEYNREAMVFGLDIAKMGDDSTVLIRRQGRMVFPPRQWRKLETAQLADQIAMVLTENPEYRALFVDTTGGWGEAVYLRLKDLNFKHLVPVDFGSTDVLDERYLNRRAEMHWHMALWVKRGCLPNDVELAQDLLAPTYGLAAGRGRTKLKIQDKDEIKAKLGRSPDKGDALALTFAAPVAPPDMDALIGRRKAVTEFNPFEHLRR